MLRKIFSKKSHTIETLVQDFKSLDKDRQALESKIEALKKKAATGAGSDTIVDDLLRLDTELKVILSGLNEIRKLLSGLISDRVEQEYKSLDKTRAQYEKDTYNTFFKHGEAIGRAIKVFKSMHLPAGDTLGRELQSAVDSLSKNYNPNTKPDKFFEGVDQGKCTTDGLADFSARKKELYAIGNRVPGTAGAQHWISSEVERLLKA